MARIQNYTEELPAEIMLNDLLLGSDASTGATRNFPISAVVDFVEVAIGDSITVDVTGIVIHSGATPPSNVLGGPGAFYIQTGVNPFIWGPKGPTAWPSSGVSLVGPAGMDGVIGVDGADGDTGADGAAGIHGTDVSNPRLSTVVGEERNLLIDVTTYMADGTANPPTIVTLQNVAGLVGSDGDDGDDGVRGTDVSNPRLSTVAGEERNLLLDVTTYMADGTANPVTTVTLEDVVGTNGLRGSDVGNPRLSAVVGEERNLLLDVTTYMADGTANPVMTITLMDVVGEDGAIGIHGTDVSNPRLSTVVGEERNLLLDVTTYNSEGAVVPSTVVTLEDVVGAPGDPGNIYNSTYTLAASGAPTVSGTPVNFTLVPDTGDTLSYTSGQTLVFGSRTSPPDRFEVQVVSFNPSTNILNGFVTFASTNGGAVFERGLFDVNLQGSQGPTGPAGAIGLHGADVSNPRLSVVVGEERNLLLDVTTYNAAGAIAPPTTVTLTDVVGADGLHGTDVSNPRLSTVMGEERNLLLDVTTYNAAGAIAPPTVVTLTNVVGAQGSAGPVGPFIVDVFTRAAMPPTAAPTGGVHDGATLTEVPVTAGLVWSDNIPAGTDQLYESRATYTPSTSMLSDWSLPFIPGSVGPQGLQGVSIASVAVGMPDMDGNRDLTITYTGTGAPMPQLIADAISDGEGVLAIVAARTADDAMIAALTTRITITYTDARTPTVFNVLDGATGAGIATVVTARRTADDQTIPASTTRVTTTYTDARTPTTYDVPDGPGILTIVTERTVDDAAIPANTTRVTITYTDARTPTVFNLSDGVTGSAGQRGSDVSNPRLSEVMGEERNLLLDVTTYMADGTAITPPTTITLENVVGVAGGSVQFQNFVQGEDPGDDTTFDLVVIDSVGAEVSRDSVSIKAGVTGESGTVAIQAVTTTNAGTLASITEDPLSTITNRIYDLSVPRGDAGEKGSLGPFSVDVYQSVPSTDPAPTAPPQAGFNTGELTFTFSENASPPLVFNMDPAIGTVLAPWTQTQPDIDAEQILGNAVWVSRTTFTATSLNAGQSSPFGDPFTATSFGPPGPRGTRGFSGIGITTIMGSTPVVGMPVTVTVDLTDPSSSTTPADQTFMVPAGAQGDAGDAGNPGPGTINLFARVAPNQDGTTTPPDTPSVLTFDGFALGGFDSATWFLAAPETPDPGIIYVSSGFYNPSSPITFRNFSSVQQQGSATAGPQGPIGPPGTEWFTTTEDFDVNTTTSTPITDFPGIKVGDYIVDVNSDVFQATAVSPTNATIASRISLRGAMGTSADRTTVVSSIAEGPFPVLTLGASTTNAAGDFILTQDEAERAVAYLDENLDSNNILAYVHNANRDPITFEFERASGTTDTFVLLDGSTAFFNGVAGTLGLNVAGIPPLPSNESYSAVRIIRTPLPRMGDVAIVDGDGINIVRDGSSFTFTSTLDISGKQDTLGVPAITRSGDTDTLTIVDDVITLNLSDHTTAGVGAAGVDSVSHSIYTPIGLGASTASTQLGTTWTLPGGIVDVAVLLEVELPATGTVTYSHTADSDELLFEFGVNSVRIQDGDTVVLDPVANTLVFDTPGFTPGDGASATTGTLTRTASLIQGAVTINDGDGILVTRIESEFTIENTLVDAVSANTISITGKQDTLGVPSVTRTGTTDTLTIVNGVITLNLSAHTASGGGGVTPPVTGSMNARAGYISSANFTTLTAADNAASDAIVAGLIELTEQLPADVTITGVSPFSLGARTVIAIDTSHTMSTVTEGGQQEPVPTALVRTVAGNDFNVYVFGNENSIETTGIAIQYHLTYL